ncbi:MAG TPA: PAS domain S-box protein, partial [bacterium]|nr:PAS domain S-box protein [bacterium]
MTVADTGARLLALLPDGVIRCDAQSRIIDSNAACQRLLGYVAGDLCGRPVTEVMPAAAADSRQRQLIRRDGQRIYADVTEVRDLAADGSPEVWLFIHDLARIEQTLAALRADEERYRTLADFLPIGVFEIDHTGRLAFANRHLYRIFGYTPADATLGHSVMEYIHPDDRGRALVAMHEALAGVSTPPGQYRAQQRDGTGIIVEIQSTVVKRGGSAIGLRGYMRDVSVSQRQEAEVRRTAEELERLNAELRKLDELKNNLLSTVSHELRTPLVAVRGYTELIAEGYSGPVNDRQQDQLRAVLRNLDRLVYLIDNLLTFSRLQGSEEPLALETVDLTALVVEALTLLLPKARARRVALQREGETGPVMLAGDPKRLQQVLINLIDNAIKFS